MGDEVKRALPLDNVQRIKDLENRVEELSIAVRILTVAVQDITGILNKEQEQKIRDKEKMMNVAYPTANTPTIDDVSIVFKEALDDND